MSAKRNFETRFRSAIGNLDFCKLLKNGVGVLLLLLIFYSASAQNLSIQMYINGDPYNTADDLELCAENEICLKITNNTGDSKTITARVGLSPSFFHVSSIGSFSFVGGTNHDYEVVDTYSAYEEKEFCLDFCVIYDYGTLQNRFAAAMPPGGPSNQASTLYTMPGLNLPGVELVTGNPITVTQAISNTTLLDCPDCESNAQNILINGVLEIDQDYTFFGSSSVHSKIQMGPNAKILVKSGKTLRFLYSDIFGCPDSSCGFLWESIELEPGAWMSMDYCTVEDAAYAVRLLSSELSNRSSIIIQHTTFDANFIGIDISKSPTGALSGHSIRISYTNFNGSKNLLPVYNNMLPEVKVESFAGIRSNNHVGFNISAATTSPNSTFSNLANGIILVDAAARIRNVDFEDIKTSNIYSNQGLTSGYGISAVRSLFVIDENNTVPVTFSNVDYALYGRFTEMSINKAEISNSIIGINVINQYTKNVYITGCDIQASRYGIRHIFGRSNNTRLNILNNNVEIGIAEEEEGLAGIRYNATLARVHKNIPTRIEGNTINLNNAFDGISVSTARALIEFNPTSGQMERVGGLNILDNNININDSESFKRNGMFFNSSNRSYICSNTITGVEHDIENSVGIHMDASSLMEVESNTIDNLDVGILFRGDCRADYRLKANQFYNHNIGLSIGQSPTMPFGLIGVQSEDQQNRWFEEPISMEGFQASNFEFEITQFPQIHMFRAYDRSTYLPEPSNPDTWITKIDDNAPGYEYECDIYPPQGFNDNDDRIVREDIEFSQYQEEQLWMAKLYLFMDLREVDSTYRADSLVVLDSFYHAEKNGTFGLFASFLESLDLATRVSSLETEELDDLTVDILDLTEDMYGHYHSAIPSFPDSSDFVYNIANLSTLQSLRKDLDSLSTDIETTVISNLEALRTDLSGLPDTTLIEYNLKYSLEALLEFMISDDLDSIRTEFDELVDIAELCPLEGGLGVYIARGLLEDSLVYDDDITCALSLPRSQRKTEEITLYILTPSILVFPNPADQFINIRLNNFIPSTIKMGLIDINGKVIHQQRLEISENKELIHWSLKGIPSGVYFLQIDSESFEEGYTRKINIIK